MPTTEQGQQGEHPDPIVVEETSEDASALSVEARSLELNLSPPNELTGPEKAKFTLAKWVLGASAILMLVAWGIQYWGAFWYLDIGVCRDVGTNKNAGAEQIAACAYAAEAAQAKTIAASSIFEFAKTWIPPIITLVLGYYFAREGENSNASS